MGQTVDFLEIYRVTMSYHGHQLTEKIILTLQVYLVTRGFLLLLVVIRRLFTVHYFSVCLSRSSSGHLGSDLTGFFLQGRKSLFALISRDSKNRAGALNNRLSELSQSPYIFPRPASIPLHRGILLSLPRAHMQLHTPAVVQ